MKTSGVAKDQWSQIDLTIQCQIITEAEQTFINCLVGHFSLAVALWVMR